LCVYPLEPVECFAEWLSSIGYLGVFWAKRIASMKIVGYDPPVLLVRWLRSRRWKAAYIYLCLNELDYCLEDAQERFGEDVGVLVVTRYELPPRLYDRWSKVFIYNTYDGFLQPNGKVVVEVYHPDDIDNELLRMVEAVQRRSWGFYVSPPKDSYVILALLDNYPVGSAYYNPVSSNVDYGVHVARHFWRRRIGTRLLVEAADLARMHGKKYISVVRVLRGVTTTGSDRRAISFYRANHPLAEANVYRIVANP